MTLIRIYIANNLLIIYFRFAFFSLKPCSNRFVLAIECCCIVSNGDIDIEFGSCLVHAQSKYTVCVITKGYVSYKIEIKGERGCLH